MLALMFWYRVSGLFLAAGLAPLGGQNLYHTEDHLLLGRCWFVTMPTAIWAFSAPLSLSVCSNLQMQAKIQQHTGRHSEIQSQQV